MKAPRIKDEDTVEKLLRFIQKDEVTARRENKYLIMTTTKGGGWIKSNELRKAVVVAGVAVVVAAT